MKEPAAVKPEFSRPLPADSVGPQPLLRRIEAGPAERDGLAKRFDLLALDRLEAAVGEQLAHRLLNALAGDHRSASRAFADG